MRHAMHPAEASLASLNRSIHGRAGRAPVPPEQTDEKDLHAPPPRRNNRRAFCATCCSFRDLQVTKRLNG